MTVFFNLLRLKAPLRTKKKWRHRNMPKMTIFGTLSSKALIKRQSVDTIICYSSIWWYPWHLLTAPLCAATPWFGIPGLWDKNLIWLCLLTYWERWDPRAWGRTTFSLKTSLFWRPANIESPILNNKVDTKDKKLIKIQNYDLLVRMFVSWWESREFESCSGCTFTITNWEMHFSS
jgi:hypothetical protein